MITKKSLGIFWGYDEGQEEADGVVFFGLWKDKFSFPSEISSFAIIWGADNIKYKPRIWDAEEYKTFSLEVLILNWPSSDECWDIKLRNSLQWFTNKGAIISWCGDEFCSPNPHIFDVKQSCGNVYAAWMPKIGIVCNSKLSEEFLYLSDEQLKLYHSKIMVT